MKNRIQKRLSLIDRSREAVHEKTIRYILIRASVRRAWSRDSIDSNTIYHKYWSPNKYVITAPIIVVRSSDSRRVPTSADFARLRLRNNECITLKQAVYKTLSLTSVNSRFRPRGHRQCDGRTRARHRTRTRERVLYGPVSTKPREGWLLLSIAVGTKRGSEKNKKRNKTKRRGSTRTAHTADGGEGCGEYNIITITRPKPKLRRLSVRCNTRGVCCRYVYYYRGV